MSAGVVGGWRAGRSQRTQPPLDHVRQGARSTAGRLVRLVGRNSVWSTAIYVEAESFHLGDPLTSPHTIFDSKRFRRPSDYVHVRADPFLFVSGDELYLFVEAQPVDAPGHIEAYKTRDLSQWVHLGDILREPHHLSYPFVFAAGGETYMIPESVAAGEVSLYRFEAFPFSPRKVRVLLQGDYVDSSAVKVGDKWYLFTTSPRGLELFVSPDILAAPLDPHPLNPISTDAALSRSGGAPVQRDGFLYRFAQDCSRRYGGNLNLLRIEELSPTTYTERVERRTLFDCEESWNSMGGHHMSIARFAGRTVIAVDGEQPDYYIHKVRKLLARLGGAVGWSSRTGAAPADAASKATSIEDPSA